MAGKEGIQPNLLDTRPYIFNPNAQRTIKFLGDGLSDLPMGECIQIANTPLEDLIDEAAQGMIPETSNPQNLDAIDIGKKAAVPLMSYWKGKVGLYLKAPSNERRNMPDKFQAKLNKEHSILGTSYNYTFSALDDGGNATLSFDYYPKQKIIDTRYRPVQMWFDLPEIDGTSVNYHLVFGRDRITTLQKAVVVTDSYGRRMKNVTTLCS